MQIYTSIKYISRGRSEIPCVYDIDVDRYLIKHVHDPHFPGFVQIPNKELRELASFWTQIVK